MSHRSRGSARRLCRKSLCTAYSNNNNICTSYIVFRYVIIILCKIIIIIIYVAPHEHCRVDIGPGEEQEEIRNNKKRPTDERSADRVRERERITTMRYLKNYNYNIYMTAILYITLDWLKYYCSKLYYIILFIYIYSI
jgi:hypothetical protein